MWHSFCRAAANKHVELCSILMNNTTVIINSRDILITQKKGFLPLPTNFCGIVLLRLATLLANLSSTKALSDPVWLKSSLCSLWLLSSFITGKQDKEMDFSVKVIFWCIFQLKWDWYLVSWSTERTILTHTKHLVSREHSHQQTQPDPNPVYP